MEEGTFRDLLRLMRRCWRRSLQKSPNQASLHFFFFWRSGLGEACQPQNYNLLLKQPLLSLAHSQVESLAKIGGQGKHPGNMHRDLVHIIGQSNLPLQGSLSTYPVTLKPKQNLTEQVGLNFLLPHKLFASIFNSLPAAFLSSVLGGDEGNVGRFWTTMKHHPIVVSRPELQSHPDLHKAVPLALHGDGVRYMQTGKAGGKTLDGLSWCSLLTKGPTKVSSFLAFLLVKTVAKESGFSQTWSKVWKILAWSFPALSHGVWLMRDWNGEEFKDVTSTDYLKKGTPLASGHAAVLFVVRADLEFLSNHFKLNNPSSNSPCALCQADRDMKSNPWTDCRTTAQWRRTIWSAPEWAATHPASHPFFKIPGCGLDLVFPDLTHLKHLGTDQLLLGSVLTWLVKHYLSGTVSQNLDMVWLYIQNWSKDWGTHSLSLWSSSSLFEGLSPEASCKWAIQSQKCTVPLLNKRLGKHPTSEVPDSAFLPT